MNGARLAAHKKDDDYKTPPEKSFTEKWFSCFSLCKNLKSIACLKSGPGSIESVHGIRALSMPWVVTGHIILYGHGVTDNLESNLTYMELWHWQPLTTDFLGVDTFIALSGFLLSYLFFEQQKMLKRHKPPGFYTVLYGAMSRYIRLAPYLFIVVLMGYTMTIFLEDTTPFKVGEDIENNCGNYWWRNILLINNLFTGHEICLTWTWFASNDFQSFILGLSILIVYSRYEINIGLLN